MIDEFIEYLKSHIGDAYVWGSQGENVSAMPINVRDAWIKRRETTAANAQRAINYCNRSRKNPLFAFDCSGLITKFLLDKKIIKADKNSHALYSDSEPIEFSQLQVGDFVFRHNGSRVYHIGVYIGGNMVIEAKGRDDGVVCRNLSANGYNYWNKAGHYKPLFDAQDNIVPVRQDEFYAKCAGEKVNVRVGAGTNYSSICKLSKNAKMLALPAVNGWCKIAFCENNELKTGFMYSQYVQKA